VGIGFLDADGVLAGAVQVPSPNCDERPERSLVTLLVVHNISLPPGEFGGDAILRLFTNSLDPAAHPYYEALRDLNVSAHFLIRRDGELIQFVPCAKRAWHAGPSSWQGRERCNDFAVGVELEGCDDQAYADQQYPRLAELRRCAGDIRSWTSSGTQTSLRAARPIRGRRSIGGIFGRCSRGFNSFKLCFRNALAVTHSFRFATSSEAA